MRATPGVLKLLVVDDDADERGLLLRTLEPHFEVRAVDAAERALTALETEHFDMVLAPRKLAEMEGVALLARARLVQPHTRRVVLSEFSHAGELLSAIDTGDVHRVLTKPVSPQAIRACAETLRADTLPSARLCVVIGEGEQEIYQIADTLNRTREMIAMPQRALQPKQRPALLLLVEPKAPQVVAEVIETLGGADRRCCLMGVLSLRRGVDAASFIAAGLDEVVWTPPRAEEILARYMTWRSRRALQEEAERVRKELLAEDDAFPHLVGRSAPMTQVLNTIHRVGPTDTTVLLGGETGTGKELVARTVHAISHRRAGPFVAVNLSALPETLIESELFGHEQGAFTGASAGRKGRFESAEGGTLFLDEIGDLAPSVQVKLLRVLEERRFERLGSNTARDADFRLVCATHRDLEEMVAEGKFRADLYYRINVVHVTLPPLREREGDILLLAHHFLRRHCKSARKKVILGPDLLTQMQSHDWPGNVRELEHFVERAVALAKDGDVVQPEKLSVRPARRSFRDDVQGFFQSGRGLKEVLQDIERAILTETLQRYDGNQVAAAKKLRVPRATLQNRLRKLGL
jgi:DNA-binding NtrC family response regulator